MERLLDNIGLLTTPVVYVSDELDGMPYSSDALSAP